jgi:predicted permease
MIRQLIALFRRSRLEEDMSRELRFHLERQIEDNVKKGMTPQEARHAALRTFGGLDQIKEECRDRHGMCFIEDFLKDLRYSLRMLRRSPGFTAVAVLSLALGIGANTAIFSVMNAVMIRYLPVSDPERLVVLRAAHLAERRYISYPMYRDIVARQQIFEGVLATASQGRKRMTIAGPGRQLEQVRSSRVSANYFSVLGVRAQAGRVFSAPAEDSIAPEAVISDEFWERQFGRSSSAIGETLRMTIGNYPDAFIRDFTIVGVAPPEFFGEEAGDAPEVWIPIYQSIMPGTLRRRNGSFIEVMARLHPAVSHTQARVGLDVLYQQLLAEEVASGVPSDVRSEDRISDFRIELERGSRGLDGLRRQYAKPLTVLMATVGVLLLIACCNVANLLLAQGSTRSREIGVRLALGAGRGRLVRQLLTESLVLALSGAALGLLLARFGSDVLVSMITVNRGTLILDVTPDARVLAFTLALATATALLFGVLPALRSASVDAAAAVKSSGRTQTAGRRSQRFGKALIAAQVALSLALLSGSALLVRSLQKLRALDAGFDRTNVLLVDIEVHSVPRPERPRIYREIERGLYEIPGVRSASLSWVGVFNPGSLTNSISFEGYTPPPGRAPGAKVNITSPGYFETVGMVLAAGRGFNERDAMDSPPVAVVNETFARSFFGRGSALGRRFSPRAKFVPAEAVEIVGVVRDAKYNDLRREASSMFFLPLLQRETDVNSIEVRTQGSPLALSEPVRRLIARVHNEIEIGEAKTLEDQVDRSLTRELLLSKLSSFFGLAALALACIGLYGVLSYAVGRRTQEIGIRMALGARRSEVLGMVLRDALLLASLGTAAGLPLALAAGRLVESFLFGLSPADPLTLAGAALLMFAVALFAGYLPARRASRVDPMVALRYE